MRGWAAYYRTVVSSQIFSALDRYVWKLAYKWAKHSHPKKSKHWIVNRYFGRFNKSRQDYWVFGDRSSGAYLVKHAWTKIVRHQLVKMGSSPDDPALAEYWARRRSKSTLPVNRTAQRLYRAQDGRCAICKVMLVPVEDRPQTPHEWEHWLATTRKTIDVVWDHGTPDEAEPRLIHLRCHHGRGPALLPVQAPSRLARAGCRETGKSGS